MSEGFAVGSNSECNCRRIKDKFLFISVSAAYEVKDECSCLLFRGKLLLGGMIWPGLFVLVPGLMKHAS